MYLFGLDTCPPERGAGKDPFYAGEERREELGGGVLGFEEFGVECVSGAGAAVEEDYGVGVGVSGEVH
jgi:hypothetical protein